MTTEQEAFWSGSFGDDYVARNEGPGLLACNLALFARILRSTSGVKSALEFGANVGMNLRAIKLLMPAVEVSGIELNAKAAERLRAWDMVHTVYHQSILDFTPDYERDLVLIKTVLIHINPDMLGTVYEKMYASARKYICIAEYFSPQPVTVVYRGNTDKLFKRDFAGEMLDKYPSLRLIDYGFVYHRDNNYKEYDSINWFLLEKTGAGY